MGVTMLLYLLAIVAGLAVLVWSADKFIDGAATLAKHLGVSALLIGIIIVGFGTSAPEITVSIISALENRPELALGNAYGSNIANIALILGLTALIGTIAVQSDVLRRELPILLGATIFGVVLLLDGSLSRLDGILLLAVLAGYMGYSIWRARKGNADHLIEEVEHEMAEHNMTKAQSIFWIVLGLVLLIASSRALVWGAVGVAEAFGVSELIIGLTVVAIGTSLPELVSSIVAARKGEYDMVLGNIIGSNFFNMLAVVGIAAMIQPMAVGQEVLQRDVPIMVGITVLLFAICWIFKAVNRYAGMGFVAIYVGYTLWLINTAAA